MGKCIRLERDYFKGDHLVFCLDLKYVGHLSRYFSDTPLMFKVLSVMRVTHFGCCVCCLRVACMCLVSFLCACVCVCVSQILKALIYYASIKTGNKNVLMFRFEA